MNELVEAIRIALAPEVTPEARVAGATACRTILAALEAKPGEPLGAAVPAPITPATAIAAAIRGMPVDQLLDLAIARVRAALPADAAIAPVQPIKFMHVAVPGAKP